MTCTVQVVKFIAGYQGAKISKSPTCYGTLWEYGGPRKGVRMIIEIQDGKYGRS